MEVPHKPPPLSLALHTPASPALSSPAAGEKVTVDEPMRDELHVAIGGAAESDLFSEGEVPEPEATPPVRRKSSLSTNESCSDEETLQEDEVRRRTEEEAAARERRSQRQLLAVEELVQSERNYLRLLQVSSVTIRSNLHKLQPPPPHLDSLFLHIEGVIDVSGRFLSLLDQTQVRPGDPQFLQTLCDVFLGLSADLEAAYREYLAHYGEVTALENAYKQEAGLWAEIVRVVKASAPEVNAASLTFFLVMPVQRVARYPLLLQTIQSHTDRTRPGHALLERTAHTAIALNRRINEYKRFREVADKYKKTENLSIRDRIQRISTHSIAKKTARLSQHLKHETGMAPKLVDEEFEALEAFFYVLEHGILQLLENVEMFLQHLQGLLACRTEGFDLDLDGEKTAICYKEISTALRQWLLPAFEKRMRTLVYRPLCGLRDLLGGPRNLIRKRLDKLLDYELICDKSSLSYEEQGVANTYRTINTLLVGELPVFNGVALQLLWAVLGTLSCLHRDLASDMEQLFQGFAQQLPHSSLEPGAFWRWAESAALDSAKRLEGLCRSVAATLNAPVIQPLSPSSRRRLQLLTEKHSSGRIFQVTAAVGGGRDLDLSLARGELVAVISQEDSRGDQKRWLVDAGGRRGYAPSSKLIRYHQPAVAPPPSPHPVLPDGMMGGRRHSFTPEGRPLAVSSPPCFQVFAAYDFVGRGHHEVSVRAGEAVRVLEPHDKRGNPEWSLVQTGGGRRGYAPSNYLTLRPPGAGPPDTRPDC
ncbi:rho guanine nucleotide exchange factor 37 isoform X2 [Antennarius striatus]